MSKIVASVETDDDGTVRVIIETKPKNLLLISPSLHVPRLLSFKPPKVLSLLSSPYNDTAWSLLYQGICSSIGASPTTFQLVYPFISWNWPTANTGYTGSGQYDFCSEIPQWSATGAYAAGSIRFHDAFNSFLQCILPNTGNPQEELQIQQARNNLTNASNQYTNDYNQANLAYQTAIAGAAPPIIAFTAWLGTGAGFNWQTLLNADISQITRINNILQSLILKSTTVGLAAANSAYLNTGFYTKLQDPGLSGYPSVPAYSVSEDATQWTIQAQGGGGTPAKFSIDMTQQAYSYQNTWAQGSTSVGSWFWETYVNGQWQQITEFQSAKSLSINVAFKAVDVVNVTPSGWYTSSFPRSHREGPFVDGFSGNKTSGVPNWMWGDGGLLNIQKTGFYVAYQPSITIQTDQDTYNSFSSSWKTSGGLRIGPFTFGGEGGQTTNTYNSSTSGTSFVVESTSTTPIIFGNVIAVLP